MQVLILAVIGTILPAINGHGRLLVPPARGTAWREGFDTPEDYNDNELNCGGFSNQWGTHDGKCGLCGDPYQGPRVNEAGGLYATGTIVRSYTSGDIIDVTVQITANHEGYHQFRLCEHNDPSTNITQECLDEHLLPDAVHGNTDHVMDVVGNMNYIYHVQLPSGISCSHCVLQWKYNAGNSWGVDEDHPEGCIGCGPQEQFYGCADVSISGGDSGANPEPLPATTRTTPGKTTPTTPGKTTPTTSRTTTTRRTTTIASSEGSNCVPTELYEDDPDMPEWCEVNCAAGYCPSTHCVCINKISRKCRPRTPWAKVAGMAGWCQRHCPHELPACERTCSCVF